jgi:hypothetical protein
MTESPTQAEVDASKGKVIGEPGYTPTSVLAAFNGDVSEFAEEDD